MMATLNLRQNENVSPSQVMIFINLEIQRHLSDKEYWGTEQNIKQENFIYDYALKNKIVDQDWFDARLKHTCIEMLQDLYNVFSEKYYAKE